jgi:choline dehydrogenase-like flavoprotein
LHGTSGPISAVRITTSHPQRKYPLRESIESLLRSAGFQPNPDGNSGSVEGFSERCENWKDGKRQPASIAYGVADCNIVTVLTSTLVYKVLFKNTTAIGVDTVAGTFLASKEVILSAGAYRSPQLLMLSGIGPASTLSRHDIPLVLHVPDVGAHLHDHLAVPLYWNLKVPNAAMGDASLSGPAFKFGLPSDWLAFSHDPAVPAAAEAEGADARTVAHLKHPACCHTEIFTSYAVTGPGVRMYKNNGATATTTVVIMTPTSRGSVSIASADPEDMPVIDPNYYATEADRVALRNAMRKMLTSMLDTEQGHALVEAELTEHQGSSDAAIDARVMEWGTTLYHPAGSCAMGKVVDGQCRVIGLERLRVVDASIIPLPIGGHYQATVYALAEKAADSI